LARHGTSLGTSQGTSASADAGGAGMIALALAFAVYSGAVVLFRYRDATHDGTFGMTTVVAAMLAFALGSYAVIGDMRVAGAFGVATAALLALKPALHAWVRQLSWVELRSGLVLAAMTFIALPLLPNRTVDPWGAINPFELWLMTILIAAISFAGYAAIKLLGAKRGILFGAIAGGLASSTAVTLTNARLARLHPGQRDPLIGGALIAGTTMVARVLIVASLLNWGLFDKLAAPLIAAGVVLAGAGLWLLHSPVSAGGAAAGEPDVMALKNPFELDTVLKFGALLTVISVLAQAATSYAGSGGVYALAAVSGIADVDAITLSMARLGGAQVTLDVAAIAIALAVAVNTVSKAALGLGAGGPEVGRRLGIASGLAAA
ncbi:MAG: DUF4010 domain-containing protein, partial [Hyphomicrobium sp.]